MKIPVAFLVSILGSVLKPTIGKVLEKVLGKDKAAAVAGTVAEILDKDEEIKGTVLSQLELLAEKDKDFQEFLLAYEGRAEIVSEKVRFLRGIARPIGLFWALGMSAFIYISMVVVWLTGRLDFTQFLAVIGPFNGAIIGIISWWFAERASLKVPGGGK